MNIDLAKLKKQAEKVPIVTGIFKNYPSRNIQHNYKHLRVNRINSLFVAQIIKLNSILANNVGVTAIQYDYFFEYEGYCEPYIYCEILPESKNKMNIPKFYNSIQGYEALEILLKGKRGKKEILQNYIKQVLFALYIGDVDRNWNNFIAYFDESKSLCLYPMFDFDQCFAFGSFSGVEILYNHWYLNDEENSRNIAEANVTAIEDAIRCQVEGEVTPYTDDNYCHIPFLGLLQEILNYVEENDFFYDVPSNKEEVFSVMLLGEEQKRNSTLSSVFEFCYSRLEDKDLINRMLDYNLESLFDVPDNYGFNKRTKLFYLSLMEIQKNKLKRELKKFQEKNDIGKTHF